MPAHPSACHLGRSRSAAAVMLLRCEHALPVLGAQARQGQLLPLVLRGVVESFSGRQRSCHERSNQPLSSCA